MKDPVRVLAVDDSPDLTEYIRRMLRREPDMECVGTLDCADEVVAQAQHLNADVVLLDLSMPGTDPASILPELAQERRVVVLSGLDDQRVIDRCRSAGAAGFVSKDAGHSEILASVRAVASGGSYYPGRPVI
jgi:two-component system, NarL family, response regulator EvgA